MGARWKKSTANLGAVITWGVASTPCTWIGEQFPWPVPPRKIPQSLTGSWGKREPYSLGCTPLKCSFWDPELGAGREQILIQIPRILAVLTESQSTSLNEYFFICFMLLGQFPGTSDGCLLNNFHQLYLFRWGVHRAPRCHARNGTPNVYFIHSFDLLTPQY